MPRTTKFDSHCASPQPDRPVCGRPDPTVLARLLDEWMQGDEMEQRETFEFLRQALDEDRPAAYKLFP